MVRKARSFVEEFDKLYNFYHLLKHVVMSLILIIIIDYYNLITRIVLSSLWLPVGILGIILGIVYLKEIKVICLSKVRVINDIDWILIYVLLTSLCASIMISILEKCINYKVYGFLIILTSIFIAISVRVYYLYVKEGVATSNNFNVYDLKQLYDGTISSFENRVLIGEEDVDYDLLERGEIITELYEMIIECNPSKKIVLSLEGPWGSGKTTIINNVKKELMDRENIIVIDEFDPWTYSNQSSMFRAMFDILLEKTEIKYRITKTKAFVDDFYSILFDNKYTKGIKGLKLHTREEDKEIRKIKSMINNYLRITNKKVVFIIDNIDRTDPANVIFLFNLVGNIFDFEHVIYLLSFDDIRVKKILEKNLEIDYEYLKKIIQIQIKVPEIQQDVKVKIIKQCMQNLMKGYGENDITQCNAIITDISEHILDIRDLKRFLNSVITFNYKNNRYLWYRDTIAIKIIRLYNYKLYLSIKNNEQYYISHDKEFSTIAWTRIFNKKEFNIRAKDYFQELFADEENIKYQGILKQIFPYVKKYCEGKDLEEDYIIRNDKEERYKLTRNKRICSAKYFNLYFVQGENEFLFIAKLVEELIQHINEANTQESINALISNFISAIPENWHKVLFETLECYIEVIKLDKVLFFVTGLFGKLETINDSSAFFGLSARGRAEVIIAEILLNIDEVNFKIFLESIRIKYNRLYSLHQICYWVKHNRYVEEDIKKIRKEQIESVLNNMCSEVFDNNINLYGEYYSTKNIWGLYYSIKDSDRDIKNYMKSILNKDNIIRFLWDIKNSSIGTAGCSYSINKENIDIFIDSEKLNMFVKQRETNSEQEEFVLKIYNNYIKGDVDKWGEQGVTCLEERTLKL